MVNYMPNDAKLLEVFEACFKGRHPTTDKEMYIFYLAINMFKKAIQQSAASIMMEDDVDDSSFSEYVQNIEARIDVISKTFYNYFFRVKGFNDHHFFDEWIKNMEQLAEEREEWYEEVKRCSALLHKKIMG